MKIAIIGCSYSDFNHPGLRNIIGKDCWSFQMSERYPQHTFRNYAKGGTGADYQRWAYYECYDWADVILIQNTHPYRRTFLYSEHIIEAMEDADLYPFADSMIWEQTTVSHNYSYALIKDTIVMCVNPGMISEPPEGHILGRRYKDTLDKMQELITANPQLVQTDIQWYKHISKDPKTWVLDFCKNWEPGLYEHQPFNVWKMLIDKALDANVKKELLDKFDDGDFSDMKKTTNLLYKNGYATSPEDDHWPRMGHSAVLLDYVLNDRLKECLE